MFVCRFVLSINRLMLNCRLTMGEIFIRIVIICRQFSKDDKDDIGILASLDPVALDQAWIDLVYNSEDEGKKDYRFRAFYFG